MKKIKSDDTCAYRSGNVLIKGSKDKRAVFMMSTYRDTSKEKMVIIQKGEQQKEIQKPVCVLDYTKHTGGVDCSGHYCETYAFIRKCLKWWKKLFFWCLKVCIVNSYILHTNQKAQMGVKPMSHVKYPQTLTENFVGNVHNPRKKSHVGTTDRGD
jgi:hypothetical protein